MKYNFVISDCRLLWHEESTKLYILDPYVHYRLEKTGNISNYNEIIVAPYRRKTSSDLQRDHEYVRSKFNKYINILTKRLNKIHDLDHDVAFWARALSLSFERYITFLHEIFENCETYFKIDSHDCNVLSKNSYHLPLDFEEQRYLFQHSDFGQEQMFSIYMHLFYPEGIKTKEVEFKRNRSAGGHREGFVTKLLRQKLSKATLEKIKTKIIEILYYGRARKIAIMGSFFSSENLRLLITQSKGAIYPSKTDVNIHSLDDGSIATEARNLLSERDADFDRFDHFFFESMQYCFPKIFVENFKVIERYYVNYINKYPDLQFVVSEAWLSTSSLCIGLAILKERGVKHIYNEHNYFEHPWVGSMVPLEASLVDIYVSLGWGSADFPNLVKGASLREFKSGDVSKKSYKICYVGGGANAKRPNYTASYGWSCENAPRYFNFIKLFFGNLSINTREQIFYRGYPMLNDEDWLAYDQNYMLSPLLDNIEINRDMNISARVLMRKSKLVVIDYISTAYLEALIMNIPTIFFWYPNSCYLNEKNLDFFDSLIEVGICQTDPVKAALFVDQIIDDPEAWWMGEHVQQAKDDFLNKNIGDPNVMIHYLLNLSKAH